MREGSKCVNVCSLLAGSPLYRGLCIGSMYVYTILSVLTHLTQCERGRERETHTDRQHSSCGTQFKHHSLHNPHPLRIAFISARSFQIPTLRRSRSAPFNTTQIRNAPAQKRAPAHSPNALRAPPCLSVCNVYTYVHTVNRYAHVMLPHTMHVQRAYI